MSNEILRVSNIEKYYGKNGNITKAINNISFTVNKGEFVGIMGASGSGKTTLLNCISTIDKASSGHIYINNNDITKLSSKKIAKFRREELGFIFQDFNLLDTLTAYENIALALTICKINYGEINKRITNIADKLNIKDILNKYPYESLPYMFFCHFSKDFRKLRSSDVLAILLIAYGHILPKLFEFFKLNIEIAQNIFCYFSIVVENMGVSNENLLKIDIRILFL